MSYQGSSPRMRGAPASRSIPAKMTRIIPAYAGSTAAERIRMSDDTDHPRVCGEHTTGFDYPTDYEGSSPRMRGAHGVSVGRAGGRRIIPAYAGSTAAQDFITKTDGDHPRVCGEHNRARSKTPATRGSSPRMRGALCVSARVVGVRGIIPAYAGSTQSSSANRAR